MCVQRTSGGFEAIEQICLKRPILLLTDLEMRNLNGLELTRRVREVQQWIVTPIVLITVRAGDEFHQIAAEMGVDVHLTKPSLEAYLPAHVKTLDAADADTPAL